jgi:PKD repeat protein
VGNAGPQPPTYPGMDTNQLAVQTTTYTANAYLTPPALNLNGNSNVTFMAWINPNGSQANYTGLLMNRGGPDNGCGFGFIGVTDHLGYTWNNNASATWNWDSGLAVADNEWNFVAYVITPTNAMLYLGNLDGGTTNFLQATHTLNHIAQTFAGGTIRLGGDSASINNTFNGLITEASLFTNALTTTQVQQYFLTGIGAQGLAPTVPDLTVIPADATGAGVYSGQNVRLSTTPTGTAPLTLHWQAGPDGSTWTNVPNATNSFLLLNPFMVGTTYYQLSVTNAAGDGSTTPVAITFNALPEYPAGLWTVNFQETNNIGAGQTAGGGVGHYVGRGILGNGTYWNILPHVLAAGSEYSAGTINSVSDLKDDGVTSSGISCRMNSGGSYNSLGTSLPNSSDVGNLLDQFYKTYYSPNALQFFGVPDGTYNLTCYAGNGVAGNYGSTFVVHDSANGDQTKSTAEATHSTDALSEGVNFVTFTGVHVAGGTINVDVSGNVDTGGSAIIEGAQIQLVSYDPPVAAFSGSPTNLFVAQSVTFTDASTGSITNWIWSFGDGASVTNISNASVNHIYASVGTYTVSLTVNGPAGSSATTRTSYIVASPNPTIGRAQISNGQFSLSGSNGQAGVQYRILGTTNLALPLASWTPLFTNVFATDGSYSYTNSSATNAASFFRLVSP